MGHQVICVKCNQKFDRDSIQAVRVGARRYAHASCDPDNKDLVPLVIKPDKDPDMTKLKDYINKKYGERARWVLINKQIKDYTKEKGYSLSGILKSLIYFYEVKGNSVDGSNGGIGIVDYCYQDAYQYYLNLFLAQQANQNVTLLTQTKEVNIKPPKMRGTKQKLFDLGESEE
jgi:hypothetical protein